MSSKGPQTSARTIYYAALCGIGIFYLAYRHLLNLASSGSSSEYHIQQLFAVLNSIDYGNAIAALVAVGGYLLEHWISRKASKLEKQMERVEAQSHQFLVPGEIRDVNCFFFAISFMLIDHRIFIVTIQWHAMCW